MVMINELLWVVVDKLDHVLRIVYPQENHSVVIGDLGELDDPEEGDSADKIILSLVGLQSDATTGVFSVPVISQDDRYYTQAPPLYVDAYVAIASNFRKKNYTAGLARLSKIISFLQQNPVWTRQNTPQLPDEMEKLVIDFTSLDFAQASNLWTMTGSKYAPFALYRLRRLPFGGPSITGVAPPVRATGGPPAVR